MSCLLFAFRKVLVIQMTPLLMMDTVSENGMSPQQNMERYSLNILLVFLWNNLVSQTQILLKYFVALLLLYVH